VELTGGAVWFSESEPIKPLNVVEVGEQHLAPGKPMHNGLCESFMYGRPLLCKVSDEVQATGSGAFMYAAC
jgi:hypothetical protein